MYRSKLTLGALLASLITGGGAAAGTRQSQTVEGTTVPQTRTSPREPSPPFRVIGNVYYVGSSNAGSFLVTSTEGHILIDTGYPRSESWVRESIEKLGFKLSDIKFILNTHAHADHVGGHAQFKEWTGATVVTSEADAPVIADGGRGDFRNDGRQLWTPLQADRIIRDGEQVRLGDVTLIAQLTPGHTKGNTTWTTVVEDGGRKLDVVFVGSMGLNRDVPLVGNTKYPGIAGDYTRSFELLKGLRCDVFLPFHADHYGLVDKRRRLEQGETPNPFVDPAGFRAYIAKNERAFLDQLAKERAATANTETSAADQEQAATPDMEAPAADQGPAATPPAAPPAADGQIGSLPGAAALRHGRRAVKMLSVEEAPRVDGRLDDPAWERAQPASGFLQKDPQEGLSATERTEVRVVSDGTNLYFGVTCADSDPASILSRELRRDDDLANDDTFALILDTFHDHRNGFLFRINPQGAQFDALITDEGRHVNTTWDEDWQVETHVDEQGWTAEIRIPLRIIRYAHSEGSSAFGLDFERVIRRKNELTYWNSYARDYSFHQLSQAGHLAGIEGLSSDARFRIKPYVNSQVFSRGTGDRATKLDGEVGLEDLKYAITPALTFDLTINTDFAQAEVDQVVANFDRVPVFFPEKRDFFLEGAGQFEFGVVRGEGEEVKLYHSRRIGLSESGSAIPIIAGAKVAGKVGENFTVGLLSVQTDDARDQAGSNFGLVRIRRNILSRSSIGMFTTNRQSSGSDYNRVVGLDANLALLRYFTVTGVAARSYTSGATGRQEFISAGAAWVDDLLNAGFDFYRIGEDFDTDLGFLERTGVTKYGPYATFSPRPKSGPIRQWSAGLRVDHYRRIEDNTRETEVYHFNTDVGFQNGSGIRMTPHWRFEDLRESLRLPGGLRVPPGRYSWVYYPTTYRFNPARRVTGSVQYRIEPGYFGEGGMRQTYNVNPVLRLNQYVSARIEYALNRVNLPGGDPVNVHVMNNRLDVSFNREWLTSTMFQYSNSSDLVGVNFRLRYRYGPNHDLFVVLNSVSSDPEPLRRVDRSVTVKLTRSFDF